MKSRWILNTLIVIGLVFAYLFACPDQLGQAKLFCCTTSIAVAKAAVENKDSKVDTKDSGFFFDDAKSKKSESEEFLTGGSSPIGNTGYLLYTLGILVIVCILAYFSVRFFYTRCGVVPFRQNKRLINLIEKFPLSPQKTLVVVQVGNKFLLLGVTDKEINILTQLEPEVIEAHSVMEERSIPSFNSYLSVINSVAKKFKPTYSAKEGRDEEKDK